MVRNPPIDRHLRQRQLDMKQYVSRRDYLV
jgi:hypothetical protein